jgi:integration host factor subunit alpha
MTGKNVTRVELCAAIYEKVPMSRSQSLVLVDTALNEIINTLVKGERVKLASFGSFILRKKKQRMGATRGRGQTRQYHRAA